MRAYPKPGPFGGTIIRRTISLLRDCSVQMPFMGNWGVAVSGGSDSVALALMLSKYGRRLVRPETGFLLHVNHGWRDESKNEEIFVKNFAKTCGLQFQVHIAQSKPQKGDSKEAFGHHLRRSLFESWIEEFNLDVIFTAHHLNDLAETFFLRLGRGELLTHPEGIRIMHNKLCRPFLTTSKSELQNFLKEEDQNFCEDPSNSDTAVPRNLIRHKIIPEFEKIFPDVQKKIGNIFLNEQKNRAKKAVCE